MSRASDTPISTAVVTGGHFYEVVDLHRLFRSLDGVDAYIQHMDDFTLAPPEERSSYDVVLFFTMLLEGPRGERLQALEQISANRQGVVVLHHSILAFPYSPFWRRWTDLPDLSHSVDPPEPITTAIADPDHPITAGLADWQMTDEIYRMAGRPRTATSCLPPPIATACVRWRGRARPAGSAWCATRRATIIRPGPTPPTAHFSPVPSRGAGGGSDPRPAGRPVRIRGAR